MGEEHARAKVCIRSVRYQSKDCSQSSSDETRGVTEDMIDTTNRQKLLSLVTTPSTQLSRRPNIKGVLDRKKHENLAKNIIS